MVYCINGKAKDVYSAFGNGRYFTDAGNYAADEIPGEISNELPKAHFLGSAESYENLRKQWAENTPRNYVEGNITGSNIKQLLKGYQSKREPLQKPGEAMQNYKSNLADFSFSFQDDEGNLCAISAIYRTDDPSQWAIEVIKGTNKADDEKEITLLTGMDIRDVFTPIKGLDSSGEKERVQESVENLLQSINYEPARQILAAILPQDGKFNSKSNLVQYYTQACKDKDSFKDTQELFTIQPKDIIESKILAKLAKYNVELLPGQVLACLNDKNLIAALNQAYPGFPAPAIFSNSEEFFKFYDLCLDLHVVSDPEKMKACIVLYKKAGDLEKFKALSTFFHDNEVDLDTTLNSFIVFYDAINDPDKALSFLSILAKHLQINKETIEPYSDLNKTALFRSLNNKQQKDFYKFCIKKGLTNNTDIKFYLNLYVIMGADLEFALEKATRIDGLTLSVKDKQHLVEIIDYIAETKFSVPTNEIEELAKTLPAEVVDRVTFIKQTNLSSTIDIFANNQINVNYKNYSQEAKLIECVLLIKRLQALVDKNALSQKECDDLRDILLDDSSPKKRQKLLTVARSIEQSCDDIKDRLNSKPILEDVAPDVKESTVHTYKGQYYKLAHEYLTQPPQVMTKEAVQGKIANFEEAILLLADQSSHPRLRQAFSILVNAFTLVFTLGIANLKHKEKTGKFLFFSETPTREEADQLKKDVSEKIIKPE